MPYEYLLISPHPALPVPTLSCPDPPYLTLYCPNPPPHSLSHSLSLSLSPILHTLGDIEDKEKSYYDNDNTPGQKDTSGLQFSK